MSLDEKININYNHSKDISKEKVGKALGEFFSVYKLEVLGQKRIDVLAEHYQTQLLIKISPQAGSEIGGVLLREEFARNPEIFYTGTVGRKVNFCSERYIYLVEVIAR